MNKISTILLRFGKPKWEWPFLNQSDLLLKYSVLMSAVVLLAIFSVQMLNQAWVDLLFDNEKVQDETKFFEAFCVITFAHFQKRKFILLVHLGFDDLDAHLCRSRLVQEGLGFCEARDARSRRVHDDPTWEPLPQSTLRLFVRHHVECLVADDNFLACRNYSRRRVVASSGKEFFVERCRIKLHKFFMFTGGVRRWVFKWR